MANFSFDTGAVEKRENNYELLPAGWYTAQISASEIRDMKSGNGQALKLTFDVLSEGYRGRKIWVQLNIRHTNPKAQTIAQQQLRELCEAIGLARFNDTTELHNKPVGIKVKIRKSDNPQYEDQNDVAGYKPAAGAGNVPQAGMAARPSAPAPANAPPAGGAPTPPWAKRAA